MLSHAVIMLLKLPIIAQCYRSVKKRALFQVVIYSLENNQIGVDFSTQTQHQRLYKLV